MSSINIATTDGTFTAYLAEAPLTPAPTVVVLQEAFGVNADMRAWCDDLAAQGFNAVCPDLYWRQEPGLQLSEKAKDWPKAAAFVQAVDLDKAVEDVRATMSTVEVMGICDETVGVMGFCLGALLTYLVAARGCRGGCLLSRWEDGRIPGGSVECSRSTSDALRRPGRVHFVRSSSGDPRDAHTARC